MTELATRTATREELAILRHPDRRTAWIVIVTGRLQKPDRELPARAAERLLELSQRFPILRSRWHDGRWRLDATIAATIVAQDPLRHPSLLAPFELRREPPVRLLADPDGARLVLAAHHAALDGRAMVAVVSALLGHSAPPAAPAVEGTSDSGWGAGLPMALQRLAGPADRVAPSPSPVPHDALAIRETRIAPPNITGRLAAAAVAAAGARNATSGRRWRRIGLTVAVAGPPAIGNLAGYRRLDLAADADFAGAVRDALHGGDGHARVPAIPGWLRLPAPIADRLSDSLLISNLGHLPVPGLAELCLFPVARGRSAVAIGAGSVHRGRTSITLRARDLNQRDAEALLDDVVARLAPGR